MGVYCFVVGAGASCEYGFPAGPALADKIKNQLVGEFQLGAPNARVDPSFMEGALGKLTSAHYAAARTLAGALQLGQSIDQTLHKRRDVPELMAIGKVAIAHFIAQAEAASPLYEIAQPDQTHAAIHRSRELWLHRLFCILVGDRDHNREAVQQRFLDCRFLVFNYDRNIEQFFYHAFQSILGWTEADAREVVSKMAIDHVFGHLGTLHFMGGQGAYGAASPDLRTAASTLHTYREDYSNADQLALVRSRIRYAGKLIYLGFSFAQENVELLTMGHTPTADGWATTYKLSHEGHERIYTAGVGKGQAANMSCADFIETYGEAILGA